MSLKYMKKNIIVNLIILFLHCLINYSIIVCISYIQRMPINIYYFITSLDARISGLPIGNFNGIQVFKIII